MTFWTDVQNGATPSGAVHIAAPTPLSYANPDFPNIVRRRSGNAIAAINNVPRYKYGPPDSSRLVQWTFTTMPCVTFNNDPEN